MEPIVIISTVLFAIFILQYVFKINGKEAAKLQEDKEIEALTDKFPENIEIAKDMLKMLGNDKTKVEEAKNTKTSLYIAVTNKISIADLKNNYARIQTIAHECMHSIQDRRLLIFNFIFSNIVLIYFITVCILKITGVITDIANTSYILLLMILIKFAIRGFLEIDAMTKSRYLAKEYMEKKKILKQEEINKVISKYDIVNKTGVPFITVRILAGGFIEILLYAIIGLIK